MYDIIFFCFLCAIHGHLLRNNVFRVAHNAVFDGSRFGEENEKLVASVELYDERTFASWLSCGDAL